MKLRKNNIDIKKKQLRQTLAAANSKYRDTQLHNSTITYSVRTMSFKKIYKPYKGPIAFLRSTKKAHFLSAVTDYIASRYAI